MIEKIKSYFSTIAGVLIGILAILLFRQQKKTEKAESDLAGALFQNKVQKTDEAKEKAHEKTDEDMADYKRKLDEYNKSRGDV